MVDLFPFCRESAEFRVKELRHVLDETFQHFVGEEDDEEDEEEEEFGNGQAEVEEEEEEVAQLWSVSQFFWNNFLHLYFEFEYNYGYF